MSIIEHPRPSKAGMNQLGDPSKTLSRMVHASSLVFCRRERRADALHLGKILGCVNDETFYGVPRGELRLARIFAAIVNFDERVVVYEFGYNHDRHAEAKRLDFNELGLSEQDRLRDVGSLPT